MSHKPVSQTLVLLLLAVSMVAGVIVSTIISDGAGTRQESPSAFAAESIVAENP